MSFEYFLGALALLAFGGIGGALFKFSQQMGEISTNLRWILEWINDQKSPSHAEIVIRLERLENTVYAAGPRRNPEYHSPPTSVGAHGRE